MDCWEAGLTALGVYGVGSVAVRLLQQYDIRGETHVSRVQNEIANGIFCCSRANAKNKYVQKQNKTNLCT